MGAAVLDGVQLAIRVTEQCDGALPEHHLEHLTGLDAVRKLDGVPVVRIQAGGADLLAHVATFRK